MRIQFASLQNRILSSQCERDKPNSMRIRCAFNSVLMSSVKGPLNVMVHVHTYGAIKSQSLRYVSHYIYPVIFTHSVTFLKENQ